MYLNGVMLISAVLEFGTLDFAPGNDLPYTLFLPSYAAVAHYHGLIPGPGAGGGARRGGGVRGRPLPAMHLPRATGCRRRPGRGARPARGADRTVRGLRRPGGPADRAHPVLHRAAAVAPPGRRPAGRALHRLGRGRRPARSSTDDPSFRAIIGPYTAALNHYVRAELELPQRPAVRDHQQPRRPRTGPSRSSRTATSRVADKLAEAMRANPHLKVHVASGHYDGATPYFATEHSLGQAADPGRTARQHRTSLLPGGPHDVRPRADAGAAVRGPRGLRPGSLEPVTALPEVAKTTTRYLEADRQGPAGSGDRSLPDGVGAARRLPPGVPRLHALLATGNIVSKTAAGEHALTVVPTWTALITRCLTHRSGHPSPSQSPTPNQQSPTAAK